LFVIMFTLLRKNFFKGGKLIKMNIKWINYPLKQSKIDNIISLISADFNSSTVKVYTT
jgi:hypothetical protein